LRPVGHLEPPPAARPRDAQAAKLADDDGLAKVGVTGVVRRVPAGAAVERALERAVAALHIRRWRVVVERAEVAARVLPSVVGHHRARAVELMGEATQVGRVTRTLLRHDLVEAEALVGYDPGDDRRVAAVALHVLGPLGGEAASGLGRELVEARHLRPDEKAEDIGPVEPARVLGLLMLARAVEPHRLREVDVAAQVLVARRGQQAAWEVTLVQDQALDEGLAVEPEPPVPGLHGAPAEVGSDPVLAQPRLEAVEAGRGGVPRPPPLQAY